MADGGCWNGYGCRASVGGISTGLDWSLRLVGLALIQPELDRSDLHHIFAVVLAQAIA